MKQKIIYGSLALFVSLSVSAATVTVDGSNMGTVQSLNIASDGNIAIVTNGSSTFTPTPTPTLTPAPTTSAAPTVSPVSVAGCENPNIIEEIIPVNGQSKTQKRKFIRGESYAFRVDLDQYRYGRITVGTNFDTLNSTKLITISAKCGDFNVASLPKGCAIAGGITAAYFGDIAGLCAAPVSSGVFYVNVKNAAKTNPSGDTCPVGKQCGFHYTLVYRD